MKGAVKDAWMVIEPVPEKIELKKQVLGKLDTKTVDSVAAALESNPGMLTNVLELSLVGVGVRLPGVLVEGYCRRHGGFAAHHADW